VVERARSYYETSPEVAEWNAVEDGYIEEARTDEDPAR
jgi:hypothetical protein